ncbi:MAG: hypothetical protein U0X93_13960 [Anaerolineales bacterium]
MLSNPDANVTQNRFFLPDGTLLFSASASSTGEESPASASLPANIQEDPFQAWELRAGLSSFAGYRRSSATANTLESLNTRSA